MFTAVLTEIATMKADVVLLGAGIFAVLVAASLFKWARRAL